MNIEEFEDCVDRYGDDVGSWPPPRREPAKALLRTSPAARGILSRAKLLRAAVTASGPVRAPPGLADRIVARAVAAAPPAPAAVVARRPAFGGFASGLRPAIVLPFCFLVGVAVAWLPPVAQSRGPQLDVSVLLTGLVE